MRHEIWQTLAWTDDANPTENQDLPLGQVPILQSTPPQPFWQLHRPLLVSQLPWPEQSG